MHRHQESDKKLIVSVIFTSYADKLHVKGIGSLSTSAETLSDFDMGERVRSAGPQFYNYHGSGTLPPCTEDVNWVILTKPLDIRQDNI